MSASEPTIEEATTSLASVTVALSEWKQVHSERDRATHERDEYKKAYEVALLALERLRRQLFGQKAEKVDASQLALAFGTIEAKLRELHPDGPAESPNATPPPSTPSEKRKPAPHARRRLDDLDLPEERVEIPVHGLPEGAVRIGEDVSYRLGHRRASHVRIVVIRPRYSVPTDEAARTETGADTTIVVATTPDEIVPRGMLAPEMIGKILSDKRKAAQALAARLPRRHDLRSLFSRPTSRHAGLVARPRRAADVGSVQRLRVSATSSSRPTAGVRRARRSIPRNSRCP